MLTRFSSSWISTRPGRRRDLGLPLWGASLEELDDSRQTLRDVLDAGDTTGVERTHRELGAGLTDGLRRNDSDGLAQLDKRVGRKADAVALLADAVARVACQDRTHDRPPWPAAVLDDRRRPRC